MTAENDLRDYLLWHRAYDDPGSGLSWRLHTVQAYIGQALDRRPGPAKALSLCAGDGRDLIGVLQDRSDAGRVQVTLVEWHPQIAAQAAHRAVAAGIAAIDIRIADAGTTDSYVGAVPADLVLLVGIFGNISDGDLYRTIDAAPQLCASGATLIWSRGRDLTDRNDEVRACFVEAGFTELEYAERDGGSRPAVGAMRYDGPARDLAAGERLFTFLR